MKDIPEGYKELEKGDQLKELVDMGVLDELCACGHLKSQHDDNPELKKLIEDNIENMPPGVRGHGPCKVCDCKKFTWAMFLKKV